MLVNVIDFGARPDDASIDDTEAIQAAIDHAKMVGGQVFYPTGEYLVTKPLKY